MANIAWVHSRNPHGHNYLYDFLYDGFRTLANADRIGFSEIGEAPWLHLPESPYPAGGRVPAPGARDACNIDSDQAWAPAEPPDGPTDLVIGSTHALEELRGVTANGSAPVAVIDGDDRPTNQSGDANSAAAGRMVAYFKRELPIGATWARPLPFTYPARRVPGPWAKGGRDKAVYYTALHGGNAGTRRDIAEGLRAHLGEQADVWTSADQTQRPTPEQVHDRMWAHGLVGIHWNTFSVSPPHVQGWDANRLWENFAFGLVTVAQRPFIELPDAPVDGLHIVYVDTPNEAVEVACWMVAHPTIARVIAAAGHRYFMSRHDSVARALYVLRACGIAV